MKPSHAIPAAQFLFCLLMLVASLYFEYFVKLTPCALCIVQRIIVMFLLSISFANWLLRENLKARLYFIVLGISGCLIGISLALRHVWMQFHPELFSGATCLPNISYMLKIFSVVDTITAIIKHGGADCAQVQWALLGVSMPGWLFLGYVILLTTYVYSAICSRNN